jgi:hypothetical protein
MHYDSVEKYFLFPHFNLCHVLAKCREIQHHPGSFFSLSGNEVFEYIADLMLEDKLEWSQTTDQQTVQDVLKHGKIIEMARGNYQKL